MWIDIALFIIMGAGVLYGYNKGLIQTIYAILGIFAGMLLILKLAPNVIRILGDLTGLKPTINFFVGIALTIVLVLIVLKFLGKFLNKATETPVINTINKSLGAILLGLFFATAFSFLLWFLISSGIVKQRTLKQSISYPYLETLPQSASGAINAVAPLFKDLVKEGREAFVKFKDSEDRKYRKEKQNRDD